MIVIATLKIWLSGFGVSFMNIICACQFLVSAK
jgi:hypothetical protein